MNENTCDICGYQNDNGITVIERRDGIVRCNSCVNRSLLPGSRFVSEIDMVHLYDKGHRFPWQVDDLGDYQPIY